MATNTPQTASSLLALLSSPRNVVEQRHIGEALFLHYQRICRHKDDLSLLNNDEQVVTFKTKYLLAFKIRGPIWHAAAIFAIARNYDLYRRYEHLLTTGQRKVAGHYFREAPSRNKHIPFETLHSSEGFPLGNTSVDYARTKVSKYKSVLHYIVAGLGRVHGPYGDTTIPNYSLGLDDPIKYKKFMEDEKLISGTLFEGRDLVRTIREMTQGEPISLQD